MKVTIYFLVTIGLPMLICCQLNVNEMAKKLAKKSFKAQNNDFMYKLYKCINNNVTNPPDYQ